MFEKLSQNLITLGYKVSVFKKSQEAVEYLDKTIDGKTIGIGGSVTIEQMNLYPALSKHNKIFWHQVAGDSSTKHEMRMLARNADYYFSSVNGIAETGEIINIDGNCNRVSSTLYGHQKVYFIVGKNKVAPDFESALWRARNIAAPLNAKRLNRKTPCVVSGHCHNCKSPDRICAALSVLWTKPLYTEFEIILIEEDLGY